MNRDLISQWRRWRDTLGCDREPGKNPWGATIRLSRAFSALAPEQRVELEPLLREWVQSDDFADRFIALAFVRENGVTSMIPTLRQLLERLASSSGVDARDEQSKVNRIIDRLAWIADPPPLAHVWRQAREALRRNAGEKDPPNEITMRMSTTYGRLSPEQRAELQPLLTQWLLSDDHADRFDAIAIIDDNGVTSMIPTLRELQDRLEFATDIGAPYAWAKVNRVLGRLVAIEERESADREQVSAT